MTKSYQYLIKSILNYQALILTKFKRTNTDLIKKISSIEK